MHKGDTLVEVMFAVGIFGLVAISAIALMNHGLAMSQNTLEVTMARQEIDAQISSLRFVHDAYISEGKQEDSVYQGLWGAITESAYTSGEGDNGIKTEDKNFYDRVIENHQTCDELYGDSLPPKAFIINPRKLDSSNVDRDTLVHYSDTYCHNERCLNAASVYPRLLYGSIDTTLSDATVEEGFGVVYHNDDTLTSAEGIWVVAVASESEVNNEPDFYDFYVHTCWNRTGSNGSTTINSVIRLYNPDQIVFGERAKVDKFTLIYDVNGGDKNTEPPVQEGGDASASSQEFRITRREPEWEGHNFLGWFKMDGDECGIHPPQWLKYKPNEDDKIITVYTKQTTLCASWEQARHFELNYNANGGTLPADFTNPQKSGSTFTETEHTFTLSKAEPTKDGYRFLGWADTKTATTATYLPNDDTKNTVTVTRQGTETVSSKTIYAVWEEVSLTCTKRYHKENADGSWGGWIVESVDTLKDGDTCSYSKQLEYYYDAGPVSKKMSKAEGPVILELELRRVQYVLTVNRNTNHIAAITGGGTYRWGAAAPISATPVYGHNFTSWSQTDGATGTFGNANSRGTFFIMGKSDAVIYANGKGKVNLQDWDNCPDMGLGKENSIILYDSRDGQAYTVTKYKMSADGSKTACWMSNLNLGAEPLLVSELNSSNSDMATAPAISASEFMSWKSARPDGSPATVSKPYLSKFTPIVASNSYSGSTEDAYGNKYGTLYSYGAASANTITARKNQNTEDAHNSLCPSGWRLPTETGYPYQRHNNWQYPPFEGEYNDLITANSIESSINGFNTIQSEFGFPFAAQLDNGRILRNTGIGYWSSIFANGNNMYNLSIGRTLAYQTDNIIEGRVSLSSGGRTAGGAIRCIKREHEEAPVKQYLQDWNGCSSLGLGRKNSITLYDRRDEQAYTVTKYKMTGDGSRTACLMSNLNLGAEPLTVPALDSTNTNMSSDASISSSEFASWERFVGDNLEDVKTFYQPRFVLINKSTKGLDRDAYRNVYGTLYNYAAASAKTITNGGNNPGDAKYSLCPSGWSLPAHTALTGVLLSNTEKGFNEQMVSLHPTITDHLETDLQFNLSFPLAGGFSDYKGTLSISYQFLWGYYWTRTMFSPYSDKMYAPRVNSSGCATNDCNTGESDSFEHLTRNYSLSRDEGASIRCIIVNPK